MRSFLGVPIVARGERDRRLLPDRQGGRRRRSATSDQRLIEMLAAHAAVAIENARLLERSRELSVVEERNRLARELHDSVTPEAVRRRARAPRRPATLLDRDPDDGRASRSRALGELAQEALDELRSLIFELRPAALERGGPGGDAAQARRRAAARARARHRAADRRRRRLPAGAPRRGAPHRPGGAQQRAAARRAPSASSCGMRGARRPARRDRRRRRRRLRPAAPRAALAAARPDLDGGAGAGARRHAGGRLAARRGRPR